MKNSFFTQMLLSYFVLFNDLEKIEFPRSQHSKLNWRFNSKKSKMTRIFAPLIFLCFSISVSAQFGLNARYVINDADNWLIEQADGSGNINLLDKGYAFGIDYWFRIKDLRIEFLPELNYSTFSNESNRLNINSEVQVYSLLVNTNIYFLDMSGDCTCPTFYQEGPTLKKGLHLQISPGLHYFDGTISTPTAEASSSTITYSIGAGLGFDLGFSKNLTITPIAGIRYFPGLKWEAVTDVFDPNTNIFVSEESSVFQYSAGIRVGLRFGE